ncbi:MAG: hypothetical protein WCN89_04265 [bacterium]
MLIPISHTNSLQNGLVLLESVITLALLSIIALGFLLTIANVTRTTTTIIRTQSPNCKSPSCSALSSPITCSCGELRWAVIP